MKSITKSGFREIKQTFSRFIAIFAIIALGVGFFSGIRITKSAMLHTGNEYIKELALYDFKLMSPLGFTDDDIIAFNSVEHVAAASGAYQLDFIIQDETDNSAVFRAHSICENINMLSLTTGKLPCNTFECIADAKYYSETDIGKTITLSTDNSSEIFDSLAHSEFTIVGLANSPEYLNYERGTTSVGSGRLAAFVFLLPSAFKLEAYTGAYIKLDSNELIYSDKYDKTINSFKECFTSLLEERADMRYKSIRSDAEEQLATAYSEYDDGLEKYSNAVAELEAHKQELEKEFLKSENELRIYSDTLTAADNDLNSKESELLKTQDELEFQLVSLSSYYSGVDLEFKKAEINATLAQINAGITMIADSRAEIESKRIEIEQSYMKLADARADADKKIADTEAEIAAAELELADGLTEIETAQAELESFSPPDTYLITRNENIGYICFENDTSIIDGIARIFPLFFFAVAALVCGTTMTRMVDEQRTQIGTLKALGYSRWRIMSKYLFYSGSAALAGCIVGYLIGIVIFPSIIWIVYGIMYGFAPIMLVFDPILLIISLTVSLLCSVVTTYVSCKYALSEQAAQLMRPRAPKAGKRILLERITPLWKRLKFLHKVSLRNVFRYKKRLLMMILGIGGCTALLITGFGIKDSIANIADYQYSEIFLHELSVSFSAEPDSKMLESFVTDPEKHIASYLQVCETSIDIIAYDNVKSATAIISKTSNLDGFIDLHNGDKSIAYPLNGEAVVNTKIADTLGVSVGSFVTIRNSEMKEATVKISAVCDNYVYNYIYITADTYENCFGDIPEFKILYIKSDVYSSDALHLAAAKISEYNGVNSVSVHADFRERITNMLSSLDLIVLLVIFCAGALAFIVLYNLTNININERIREIATVKVLGFFKNETASYVFRENIIMTAFAVIFGLLFGKLLHAYVMAQIQIDMITFEVVVKPISYAFSVALTFIFTILVNMLMRIKISLINMSESLKSIE